MLGVPGVTEAMLLLVFVEVTVTAAAAATVPAFSFSRHSLQLDAPQVLFAGTES